MTEQRRLAAIVSADVAGYSRLMGRDEGGTLAALKSLRQEVIDPAIASHGGRIVKTMGDGLLLEFASVVNAVRCAIEVQTALADRTAGMADDRRIAFRLGINLGDLIVEGDDIFGDGVNVAACLQEIAPPGGICISSRVHDDVRDRLDTPFDDGGTQTLKNIARPVQIWRWRLDGYPSVGRPIRRCPRGRLRLQDRVTTSVVGVIAPKLEQAEIERAMRKPTESLDAYDCFLRGMAHYHLFTKDSLLEARRLFGRATDLDHTYAAAYGFGAWCVSVSRANGGWLPGSAKSVMA